MHRGRGPPQDSRCSARIPASETPPCSKGFAVPPAPRCFHLLIFLPKGDAPLALLPEILLAVLLLHQPSLGNLHLLFPWVLL